MTLGKVGYKYSGNTGCQPQPNPEPVLDPGNGDNVVLNLKVKRRPGAADRLVHKDGVTTTDTIRCVVIELVSLPAGKKRVFLKIEDAYPSQRPLLVGFYLPTVNDTSTDNYINTTGSLPGWDLHVKVTKRSDLASVDPCSAICDGTP